MLKQVAVAVALAASTALLTACDNAGTDQAEDRVEDAAEASAVAAGPTPVALGLSEAQLLDADLRAADGVELGDVMNLLRAADGSVDRLLVEIEDSNPDRFVEIPVQGLTVVTRGDDTDLVTTQTAADLAALPAASLPTT
ncbi:MAG TPA: PRC-barrel domain containing protein [Croceibacterium sp.]